MTLRRVWAYLLVAQGALWALILAVSCSLRGAGVSWHDGRYWARNGKIAIEMNPTVGAATALAQGVAVATLPIAMGLTWWIVVTADETTVRGGLRPLGREGEFLYVLICAVGWLVPLSAAIGTVVSFAR